jgi:hypothetical protein
MIIAPGACEARESLQASDHADYLGSLIASRVRHCKTNDGALSYIGVRRDNLLLYECPFLFRTLFSSLSSPGAAMAIYSEQLRLAMTRNSTSNDLCQRKEYSYLIR